MASVSPSTPARVALLALLALSLLFAMGPASIAHAAELPIPGLAKWESQMLKYAKVHCTMIASASGDSALASTYYDMTRVMYQIAEYTGDPTWISCALRARYIYRDTYVLPNKAGVPGYWNFTTGLRMDFFNSGDPVSQQAAIMLSQRAAYAADTTPIAWTASADVSREVAYAISSYVNAEALGQPPRARRAQLVDQAYGHIKQWFVDFAWQGNGKTLKQFSPFMVGLTAHSLISDWEQTQDPRLVPALRVAADWLWANAWRPSERGMFYDALNGGTGPGTGAPDLNLLIAPMYAFLYAQTGEVKYRDQGDALFAAGVDLAWLAGPKQFDQSYWWSFDYAKWRSGTPSTPPPPTTPPPPPSDSKAPSVAIAAPASGATVSGQVPVTVSASDDVGVTALKYYVDDVPVAVIAPPSGKYSWDTVGAANGSHTLKVVALDAAGNTSQASVAVTVANLAATTTVIAAPSTINYGASAVVGVGVSAAGSTPTGSVALSIDSAAPLTAALVSGKAQFSVPGLAAGDHTLSATYVPTGAFNPSSASASLRVNPTSGAVAFSSSSYTALPLSYKAAITVVRSAPTGSAVSVRYATSDGTAKAGVDYVASSGTVNFSPGVTQQTVLVEIVQSAASAPKTLSLTLSNPAGGAVLSAPASASLTVEAASVTTGLVAAYSFNETSGSTVIDASGNNNSGAIQGATRTAQGRYGAALSFDGVSSRVVINNSPSLTLTSGMTLEAWVYPTTSTARWQDIIMKDTDAYYLESNSPRNAPGAGGTFVANPTYGTSPIPVNAWTHLAATYDQKVLRLYVNGVEVASQARTAPIAVSTKPLFIGGDTTFGQYFKGMIDQVRIYNRALSPAEIQQNMNLPL